MPKNEYTVIRLLGEGTWGSVFKVRRKLDQQIYAMKKVLKILETTVKCLLIDKVKR